MSDFGWEYPPGAESDPHAPWNEPDGCEECSDGGCPYCEPDEDDPDRQRDELMDEGW